MNLNLQSLIGVAGFTAIVAGTLAMMMTRAVAGLFWQPARADVTTAASSAVCIGTARSTVKASVPASAFTLAWMHSVEKIRWEEDYRIENGQLTLVVARVRGSGAGMEPPEGAVLRNGAWEYKPAKTTFPKLRLTHSPFTPDYEFCWAGQCREIAVLIGKPGKGEVIEVFPCEAR